MKIKKWGDLDGKRNAFYRLQYVDKLIGVRGVLSNCLILEADTKEVSKDAIIDILKLFGFGIEFEEPPKLSKREYHLVNYLHEDWWLARDMLLYAFQSKPIKTDSGYFCGQANDDFIRIPKDLFPFITSDRAWSVKELRELEVEK